MNQSAMRAKRGWNISSRSHRAQIFLYPLTPGGAALARGYPTFSPFGLAFGTADGQQKSVLLPIAEWEKVREALEELDDIQAYDEAKQNETDSVPFPNE